MCEGGSFCIVLSCMCVPVLLYFCVYFIVNLNVVFGMMCVLFG